MMNLYFFRYLPSAWFWGVRLKVTDSQSVLTSLRYSWFTRNPFSSQYFAAMMGAAEISTGYLLFRKLGGGRRHAMLLLHCDGHFLKKVSGTVTFLCDQGADIDKALASMRGEEPIRIELHSTGTDREGRVVFQGAFTWSVKKRKGTKG